MVRRMRDPQFRAGQLAGRYEPHVEPVNRLVDALEEASPPSGRGWAPYIAPVHGGVQARILSILRDPGPKTDKDSGSGMLCVENDDDTAELQCRLLDSVDLTARDLTPWNAYPWFRYDQSSGLSSPQITEGLEPLGQVIEVMKENLQVVLLQGGEAQTLWKRFARKYPRTAARYDVVETYHPGRTALRHPDPAVREAREARRWEAFREIEAALVGRT